jgi:hypothetical protein
MKYYNYNKYINIITFQILKNNRHNIFTDQEKNINIDGESAK